MNYKLARLKPLNPKKDIKTKTYTVLAPKYPKTRTFLEAQLWYTVSLEEADLLEDEVLEDGRAVFDVVTLQQAIILDQKAEDDARRREARARSAMDIGGRRAAASFADSQVAPSSNFRDWDDIDAKAPRRTAAEIVATTPKVRTAPAATQEFEPDAWTTPVVEGDSEEAEDLPHPEDTIGDEADDDAEVEETETVRRTAAEIAASVEPEKTPRGRKPKAGK